MVMLHILLLAAQIAIFYFAKTSVVESATELSTKMKFNSTNFVTTTILDIFVCGLIILMLSDFDF
jgi:hypothetical protein